MIAVLIHCLLMTVVLGVPLRNFFEFGSTTNDTGATNQDDSVVTYLNFQMPFPIGGIEHENLFVSFPYIYCIHDYQTCYILVRILYKNFCIVILNVKCVLLLRHLILDCVRQYMYIVLVYVTVY